MKKISQIIIKILLVIILIQSIYIPTSEAGFWGDIFKSGDEFVDNGKQQQTTGDKAVDMEKVQDESSKIYIILLTLGIVLTVLIGAVLGIKFVFGGIEEQAKVKETLIPYAIGCIIIYGAFGIWKLMVTLFASVT